MKKLLLVLAIVAVVVGSTLGIKSAINADTDPAKNTLKDDTSIKEIVADAKDLKNQKEIIYNLVEVKAEENGNITLIIKDNKRTYETNAIEANFVSYVETSDPAKENKVGFKTLSNTESLEEVLEIIIYNFQA